MTDRHIEIKYKDCPPEQTIANIKACLAKIDIAPDLTVKDAGIGNVYSAQVFVKNGYPLQSNGKGVTVELAKASAYAEFIERLQCGLFLYKFQSIGRDSAMNLQSYAPDGKYMTLQELEENGEWMDYVIDTIGGGLTRNKLAKLCKMYACTEEDKILTLPFYSLFEDKYVYLPASIVEHVYASNGCCAGNTREEAWVHGLSEIIERNSTIRMLTSQKTAPVIPDKVLQQYPIPAAILKKIRDTGNYDVTVFDFSSGNGFPVIGVRLINKQTQGYLVNTAADPVFEIALSRGLTELFQGQDIQNTTSRHDSRFFTEKATVPTAHNVLNQLENGNGLFSLQFFTEEACPKAEHTPFHDNSGKNNKELLAYMLDIYKAMGRPVYVRNYSFLGFHSYMIVVPGFSESRGMKLIEPIPEYALADIAAKTLRDPLRATAIDYTTLLMFFSKIQTAFGYRNAFGKLSGLPLRSACGQHLLYMTLSYAACKLGRYKDALRYIDSLLRLKCDVSDCLNEENTYQFKCFRYYLEMKATGIDESNIQLLLPKFFRSEIAIEILQIVSQGKTPFDPFLLRCDTESCANCHYEKNCSYNAVKDYLKKAGCKYSQFTSGQEKNVFTDN